MENRYNPGDVVYAKTDPATGLIVRRFVSRVYYCKVQNGHGQKELVYFERELLESSDPVCI